MRKSNELDLKAKDDAVEIEKKHEEHLKARV
jgi:hypothetical protein